MDSDDDFGDFTSVPAGAFPAADVRLNPAPFSFQINAAELDVGTSFNKFGFYTPSTDPKTSFAPETQFGHLAAVVGQDTSLIKPTESNSDDDWGDFVEHSAPAVWDNPQAFDWFGITQDSARQGLPSQPFSNGNADTSSPSSNDSKDRFSTGLSNEEARHAEQKAGTFVFDDLDVFGGMGNLISEVNKASVSEVHDAVTVSSISDEMAAQQITPPFGRKISGQTMETHGSSTSNGTSSSPIPLSLFGDSELETDNSKTELLDVFKGHTRNKARSTSSFVSGSNDLSNLIANLYTEAQPLPDAKEYLHMDTVAPKIENSTTKLGTEEDLKDSFSGFQSSTVGGSWNLERSILSLTLGLDHVSGTGSSKGDICSTAGAELQSEEASNSLWLDSISMADQCAFVEAWASILAVCASELELALDVWKQAQLADVHLSLLADLQGKRYFAAIGQVYVVALILGATSNLYKRWLHVATKKGESLQADLERCRAVWMETNLKEGVCLALNGLKDSMPVSVVSWKGIEGFAAVALEAYKDAARASVHSICRISLLPMASFSCLRSVEWCGGSYLLPLVNLWANCISQKPPATCLST